MPNRPQEPRSRRRGVTVQRPGGRSGPVERVTPNELDVALQGATDRMMATFHSLWSKVEDNPSPRVFLERVTEDELRLYNVVAGYACADEKARQP
jgi:hypothetical protein